jgi:predicted secreted Zn-dependent protease
MHYDALIHREMTTHIARYISCGLNRIKHEDQIVLCSDILKSMIDQIDYQITSIDQKILDQYRPLKNNFDRMENLNEKEKQLLYLIDYYEKNSRE